MKIAILHLSDIHFRAIEDSNHIFTRVDALAATLNEFQGCDAVLVAISGDIAFSGKAEEYKVAGRFMELLSKRIGNNLAGVDIHYALVPGNHDCDFTSANSVRDSVIFSLKQGNSKIDTGVIDALTHVQNQFFSFSSDHCPSLYKTSADRLISGIRIQNGNSTIHINCINTAWISEISEKQGSMVAPVTTGPEFEKADLVISMLHHPFNWFESTGARQFRSYVQAHSDIVLTGHEHVPSHTSQMGSEGESNEIIEGGELQGHSHSTASRFNLIYVDLAAKEFAVNQYQWKKTVFVKNGPAKIMALRRNVKLQQIEFPISATYQDYLDDPGINLTHPRIKDLTLDQIFIYPDFKRIDPKTIPNAPIRSASGKLTDELLAAKHVLITGNEKSGKTSLAKRLFVDFHQAGLVPILLKGTEINAASENRLRRLFASAVDSQFSNVTTEQYDQTPKSSRVVLIDDFQQSGLNAKGKDEFLKLLAQHTEHFVLFTDDLTPLGDVLTVATNPGPLFSSTVFQIKEMGFARREQLIKRWVTLGQEHSISDEELIRETSRIANGISSVLLQNVIPAHPITIISVIQLYELQSPVKTAQGTYGYFYEMMLTRAIANNWKPLEVDKLYTYLSALAYQFYRESSRGLSYEKIQAFTNQYHDIYATRIDLDTTLSKLCLCKILTRTSDRYEFRYKYLYYYFVARYFRDNLEDPASSDTIRGHIEQMTAAVQVEEHANILIFFSYLAKTPIIIEEILKNAKGFYRNHSWCDLDSDIAFVTSSPIVPIKFSLVTSDAKVSRENVLQRRDRLASEKPAEIDQKRIAQQGGELQQMNAAFKTLEILGQIARNFSGSLKADTKIRLTEECFGLGLRSLKVWISTFESNLPTLRRYLHEHLRTEANMEDEAERDKQISLFIFMMVEIISFSILKKISSAVGTEELAEIYSRILNSHSAKSVELLNIVIKLDHFNHTPLQEILDFHELNDTNYFLCTMLRLMVLDHLYMFPVEREARNRLCDKLGIAKDNPLLISDDHKIHKQA